MMGKRMRKSFRKFLFRIMATRTRLGWWWWWWWHGGLKRLGEWILSAFTCPLRYLGMIYLALKIHLFSNLSKHNRKNPSSPTKQTYIYIYMRLNNLSLAPITEAEEDSISRNSSHSPSDNEWQVGTTSNDADLQVSSNSNSNSNSNTNSATHSPIPPTLAGDYLDNLNHSNHSITSHSQTPPVSLSSSPEDMASGSRLLSGNHPHARRQSSPNFSAAPSQSVHSIFSATCEALGFDIAEMWLRTGGKTHQLTNSHLRPAALQDHMEELTDVYYGDKSSEVSLSLSLSF